MSGFVIGALTLLGQATLPDSLGQLANSGAVWVVIAFVIGRFARSWRVAVLAGFIALVGEVAGYYIAAYFTVMERTPYSLSGLGLIGLWLLTAAVAGPLIGPAGYLSRHGRGRIQKLGVAALGGTFVGEGLYLMTLLPTIQKGVMWLVIAQLITLMLTWKEQTGLQPLLFAAGFGLLVFGGFRALVWLDSLRAALIM